MSEKQEYYVVGGGFEANAVLLYSMSKLCEGALELNDQPVALFTSKAAARKAIRISERWADLCIEQGRWKSMEFDRKSRREVKVIPLEEVLSDG